jgi:glutamate 5-kinase
VLALETKAVELRGDMATSQIIDVSPAEERDWWTEYKRPGAVDQVVRSLEEAIDHINKFGSAPYRCHHHQCDRRPLHGPVDSSFVMWNCSTRFADGYRYGLGAEVGSPPARRLPGPVGLEGLTIYKYRLSGEAPDSLDYVGENAKKFTTGSCQRDLNPKRIVVKIGTNTICSRGRNLDHEYLDGIASAIGAGQERDPIDNGDVGPSAPALGTGADGRKKDLAMKQACAAVGQAALMMAWRDAFRKYGKCVGQVLLTYGAFSERARYLNLKKTMDELFRLDAIPIVNENDVIATDEIAVGFGDNDKLSALVASKMDADLLILLTDVDGLFDRNPDADKDAKLIGLVDEITKDIERMAGSKKDDRSVGGMRTKIGAAKIAMASGCNMVIANGRLDNVIVRVVRGEDIGTLFTAKAHYSNKERWILFAGPRGKILVDEGAEKALRVGKSPSPAAWSGSEGKFRGRCGGAWATMRRA